MRFGYVLPDLSKGIVNTFAEVPKECIWVGDCNSGMHPGDYWVLNERVRAIWIDAKPSIHPKLQEFHDDPTVKVGVYIPDDLWELSRPIKDRLQKELVGCGCG